MAARRRRDAVQFLVVLHRGRHGLYEEWFGCVRDTLFPWSDSKMIFRAGRRIIGGHNGGIVRVHDKA